jgi:hypothetical protein
MDQKFEKEWLLALERRFNRQATEIFQVRLDERPRMMIYSFSDFPAPGMLTAVTAGLSNANHPEWVHGKPEVSFTLTTTDAGWGKGAAYLAQEFFGKHSFAYQTSFAIDVPFSSDSLMNACFVYRPQFMDKDQVKFELSDRTVYLAGLFPMYNEEIAIYEAKGTEAFWNTPGFHPYDPTRASIAGK